MKKHDVHIEVLKYGLENPGFTVENLKAAFPDDFEWIWREINFSNLFVTDKSTGDCRYYLSFEDRFRLLEYEELREARQSARHAKIIAGVSILVAASSLALQIFGD